MARNNTLATPTQWCAAMLAALREIAKDAPTDDPGEGDWSDGLDSAFACGLKASHYEAARIARAAIAAAEAAGITTA